MYKVVKWHADERADLGDMEQATAMLDLWEGVRANRVFALPEGRNTGTAPTEARILGGFGIDLVNDASIGGNGYCRLNRGGGFFKVTKEGETKLGLLVGDEGQVYQILDLSAGAPGTDYAVWVRANYQDASSENRVFWNSGATEEYVDYVATREECVWEYDVRAWSAPSPGDEWVKIWKVPVVAGPAIGTIVDYRHFYFEGDAAAVYAHEWGTGNDRSADRSMYGIQDMHNFVCAIRKKIEDIQGASWWTAPAIDLDDLDDEHNVGGTHGDVNADSLASHHLRVSMSGVFPDGVWIDTTNRNMGQTEGALRLEDWAGNENSFALDTIGRPARGHPWFDDFNKYCDWSAAAVGLPADYVAVPAGTGDVYCSVATAMVAGLSQQARHGGCAVLNTAAAGPDNIALLGPAAFYLDTAKTIFLRFFGRLSLDNVGMANRIDQLGLTRSVGAVRTFFFIHNVGLYGDGNWRFVAVDGGVNPTTDLGVAPGATFQNFYFAFKNSTTITVWVSGMLGPMDINIASQNGVGTILQPWCSLTNNGSAVARESFLDQWEVMDQQAVYATLGRSSQ